MKKILISLIYLAIILPCFSETIKLSSPTDLKTAAENNTTLYALIQDQLLNHALYSTPARIATGIASDGAISLNGRWEHSRSQQWFIEEQRYGADLIQAGMVAGGDKLVKKGWKIIDWGFARQGPDGDFPGTGDPFHSTSFFVESAARAVLLSNQANIYTPEIVAYTDKLRAAARWLMKPIVASRGQSKNKPYTHCRWILAAALGETAAVIGDTEMARVAQDYARDAIALQTPEGINPEK